MKNKRLILGMLVIFVILIFGVCFLNKDFKETYALTSLDQSGTIEKWDGYTGCYIPENSAAFSGEKVNVELFASSIKWEYISLSFVSTSSDSSFIVYLKNINTSNKNDPAYFIMPDNIRNSKAGEIYELKYINLMDYNSNHISYDAAPGNKKFVTYKGKENEAVSENMELMEFNFINNNVSLGEKVNINLKYTSKKEVSACSVWFKHTSYDNVLYYPLENFGSKPYFILNSFSSASVIPGEYRVTGLTCFYKESGIEYFSADEYSDYAEYFNFEDKLFVKDNNNNNELVSDFNLVKFSLLDNEVSFGDKVDTVFATNVNASSILLSFYNLNTNDVLPVYLKGMENKYFVIPSTAVSGEYKLQYILVKDLEHSYTLLDNNGVVELYQDSILASNNINVQLNQTLKVVDNINEDNKGTYLFNSEDYSEDVKNQIIGLNDNAVVTIIADNHTLINKEIFEAIKETRKTLIINYNESEWVFNGADIEVAKDIDVAMLISDITSKNFDSSFVDKMPKKVKLLTFSDNGQLPGKVLIRLKSMELDEKFGEDNLYIYYYEKDEDNLYKVAMEIQKNHGYYEFYINHNSDYVLSTALINGDYISENTDMLKLNTVLYGENDVEENNYIYFVISAIALAIVLIFVFLFKNKKNNLRIV